MRRITILLALLIPISIAFAVSGGPAQNEPGAKGFVGEYLPDDTTVEECAVGDYNGAGCWYQAFANLAFERGVEAAFSELRSAILTYPGANVNCHISTHGIGAGGWLRSGGDLASAIAGGSELCGGFYHGVMIQSIGELPSEDPGESARRVVELCFDQDSFPDRAEQQNCVHGAGHALMVRGNNDLPKMLAVCDKIESLRSLMGHYCALGVTMENFISSWDLERRWLKSDDPIYPCNTIAPQHKSACYSVLPQLHIQLVGQDPDRLGDLCRLAGPAWAPYCIRQAYADFSPEEWGDPVSLLAHCERIEPYARACLWGMISGISSRDEGEIGLVAVERLCEIVPDGPLGEACAFAVGQHIDAVDVDTRCRSFGGRPSLDRWCRMIGQPFEMRDLGIFNHSLTGAAP